MEQKSGLSIFLDGGAHSIYEQIIRKGHERNYAYAETQEFWDYVDAYAEYVKEVEHLVDVYVSVDVIFNPKATWKVQKYLENEHKLNPLPVFHYGGELKWLKRYMANYEYIGIGGLGQEVTAAAYKPFADEVFKLICSGKDSLPQWRTHGFAVTSPELVSRYPWYSVDSGSWMQYSKYGAILVPRTHMLVPRYDKSPKVVFLSGRSPSDMKEEGYHFSRLGERNQKEVLNYLQSRDFTLGESEIYIEDDKRKENVIEEGLCNDHKLRDKFNLMFFLDLEKSLGDWPREFSTESMFPDNVKLPDRTYTPTKPKIYFAGNFPQLKNPELEKAMTEFVIERHGVYNRLITYYFKDDMESVLDLKRKN